MYKKQYYEENGAYPEIVDTEFVLHTDKVKCVLPCYGSSECDCLTGWDVTQMTDMNEVCDNSYGICECVCICQPLYFRYNLKKTPVSKHLIH